MSLKVVSVLALLSAATALPAHLSPYARSVVVGRAPVAKSLEVVDYVNPHPKYDFNYGVSDPYTGDHKSHVESRDGDVVRGQYRLIDSDGTERVVTYTADDYNGFQATVEKRPLLVAAVPAAHGGAAVYSSVPAAVSHQQVVKSEGPSVPVVRERVHTAPVVAHVPAPYVAPAPAPAAYVAPAPAPAPYVAPAPAPAAYVAPAPVVVAKAAPVYTPRAHAAPSYGLRLTPASTYRAGFPTYQHRASPTYQHRASPTYQRRASPYIYNYSY